jgi:hypothetical protein
MTRTCLHCGREFEPQHGNARLCSEQCRRERQREQLRRYVRKREVRDGGRKLRKEWHKSWAMGAFQIPTQP